MAAAGRSRHSVSAALSASDCTPRGAIVAPVMPRLVAETGPRLPWTTSYLQEASAVGAHSIPVTAPRAVWRGRGHGRGRPRGLPPVGGGPAAHNAHRVRT